MTVKQLGLFFLLTPLAILVSVVSLFMSWQQPQFQNQLQLYQTNIALQAQAWQGDDINESGLGALQQVILGDEPLTTATEQYEEARKLTEAYLTKTQSMIVESQDAAEPTRKKLQKSVNELQNSLAQLDLHLGILAAKQGKIEAALDTWNKLDINAYGELAPTAAILRGMWDEPPHLLPNAKQLIQQNLDGWFETTALIQLYQLQQRQAALSAVEAQQQTAANAALIKLAIIDTVPTMWALIGLILLLFLIAQRLIKGKKALLAQNADLTWLTPWDVETILQVFVVGFVLMGQLIVPSVFSLLPIPHSPENVRFQAFYVLATYLMVAVGAISVLYFSLKPFFPLPESWFRFRLLDGWFFWGIGGYCVALPIVVLVSLLNQQLWQGQGGSNPLLQLALESQDAVALEIFFFTAAIAAPIFEEVLFRGFLLPSLTRYFSVSKAIVLTGLLFAVAHLSLSEVLPLTALGIILGFVYTRSRNLLAPILIHSLWNSGTLLSLFILGSGN